MGGPAILPLSRGKMAEMTQAFPDREFSGIGGISTFEHALSYFLLGCGTVQVATAAMLDHAIGPNVIRHPNDGRGAVRLPPLPAAAGRPAHDHDPRAARHGPFGGPTVRATHDDDVAVRIP